MKRIFFVISLIIYANILYSQKAKITVVADPWPPYIEEDNLNGGFTLEVLREAYKTQGYVIEYINIPWARAEKEVKEGKYDILPNVWYSNERSLDLLYSDSYAVNKIKFITLKDDNYIYDGINSLSGKKVGVLRSYAYSEEFSHANIFTKVEVNTLIASIQMLLMGRVDLTLEDEVVAKNIIKTYDSTLFDKLRFSPVPFISNKLYITSGFKNSRHEEVINAFNKGLSEIKTNGIYDSIAKKYGLDISE